MKRRRMSSCWTLLALSSLMAVAIPVLRAAANETPSAMVQSAVEEILTIAYPADAPPAPESVAAQVRPILDRTMDFEAITRRAIGPGWRQFNQAERSRAVELFSAVMVRTYAGRLTGGARPKIDYGSSVATAPDRWDVPTRVGRGGSSYEIVYRVEKRPDGWRVQDIVAEGVSFVANYRAQFDALFQRGGAVAVLRALETRPAAAPARQ